MNEALAYLGILISTAVVVAAVFRSPLRGLTATLAGIAGWVAGYALAIVLILAYGYYVSEFPARRGLDDVRSLAIFSTYSFLIVPALGYAAGVALAVLLFRHRDRRG